jgi:hypothetical protein
LKLTCAIQSRLVISRRRNAVLQSRTSSGSKCHLDGQKTCCSAINFENRMGLKTTCDNWSRLATSRMESDFVVHRQDSCLRKKSPARSYFGDKLYFMAKTYLFDSNS